MRRPNILVILTDQQRWDTIGLNGNDQVQTPNLDSLARSGACFSNAYANCPVCMPSRMSMLSGQYPASLRICCNGIEMPPDVMCLQHILKPYGYRTANLGKLHFKNHSSMFRDHRDPHPAYGFDTLVHSDEPGCYDDAYLKWVEKRAPDEVRNCECDTPPAWKGRPIKNHPRGAKSPYLFEGPEDLTHTAFVVDETITFLEQHQHEPFFCIAGMYAPHPPINPPKRFVDMYEQKDLPLPLRLPEEISEDVTDEQWQKIKAYYYALVSHVDDQTGRILKRLKELGLEENTVVIFTSDHGENLGDHGMTGKCNYHDSSTRVPLIFSCPEKISSRGVTREITELVDVAPTVLDLCGVQVPPFMQGKSLVPYLEERSETTGRQSAFIEHRYPMKQGYKAVRTVEYLYVLESSGTELLYDLNKDPAQLTNIAADAQYQQTLSDMRLALAKRWFEVESTLPARTAEY